MYKWCEEQDRRRFRITPAPHSYLRLYLKSSSAAVVVPFDTAGSDIYKLLYMMSKTRFHDYLSIELVTGSVIQSVIYGESQRDKLKTLKGNIFKNKETNRLF